MAVTLKRAKRFALVVVAVAAVFAASLDVAWRVSAGQSSGQRYFLFVATLVALWQLCVAVFQLWISRKQLEIGEKQDELLSLKPDLSMEATVSLDGQGRKIDFSIRNSGPGGLPEGEGYFQIFLPLELSAVEQFVSGTGGRMFPVLPMFGPFKLPNGTVREGIVYREKIPGGAFPDRALAIGACFLNPSGQNQKISALYRISTLRHGTFPKTGWGELELNV